MAFNQGPQPSVQDVGNGVRYIDPNPTNEIVNHEDLVMYVKLVARTKGRSVLTVDSDEESTSVIAERRNVNSETNFTYPTGQNYLDTRWTNLGGGTLPLGEDVGAFGITNINIEFKSSFMPQIIIDFVDVRGATLFEQGPCSPYAAFFHLPYPVFELTVKGYYGRPVTYTLALVKFNTKFNSETGNFESKAEFVGYTYAFLADIPMGYVLAAYYMPGGKEILKNKWEQLLRKPGLSDSKDGLPPEPLSVLDLIVKAKKLETELPRLKNDTQVKDLTSINKSKGELTKLKNIVKEYVGAFLEKTTGKNGGIRKNTAGKNETLFLKVSKTGNNDANVPNNILKNIEEVNKKYLGDGSSNDNFLQSSDIGRQYAVVQNYFSQNNLQGIPDLNIDKVKNNSSGFFGTTLTSDAENNYDYFIDTYEALTKEIDIALAKIEKEYTQQKNEVREFLNNSVREILGFFPNIRNVFAIILTNVEVFLELLLRTSVEAEKYHENEDIENGLDDSKSILDLKNKGSGSQQSDDKKEKTKVYPWPTYYEKKPRASGDPGSKETYPGDNFKFTAWPEVIFVENFIKALTQLNKELAIVDLEVDNVPGFDNFAPITAYETHALGDGKAPNRWYNLARGTDKLSWSENIFRVMGENAFIIGDYTMINSLSVWKSQLGFTNGWGVPLLNGQGNSNGFTPGSDYTIGPQRLKDNPYVTANINNYSLGRYPQGNNSYGGFYFLSDGSEESDYKKSSFATKIVPTTRQKIRNYGRLDALNCMSTLAGEGQENILTNLKTICAPGFNEALSTVKSGIKSALIKQHGNNNLKTQSFDDWKKSAVTDVGVTNGDTTLIDNQSGIWSSYYNYVKTRDVWTLKGPIRLNYGTDILEGTLSSNPHNNLGSGAVLVESASLDIRSIDFNKETLGEKLFGEYKKWYAGTIDDGSFDNISNSKETLAFKVLDKRPKFVVQGKTAYETNWQEKSQLVLDKNLGLLSYDVNFYTNFYHAYDKADKSLSENQTSYWDLNSSRTILYNSDTKTIREWADFVGKWNDNGGVADPVTTTPLWTLNYPLYKNPWYYTDNGIGNSELLKESDDISYKTSSRRNWSTWWGINQWGINEQDDIYKPLAYIAAMSFGFDNSSPEKRTGYFPPFDGNKFDDLSSFSNFTSIAVSAILPKAYIVMIGAILWRLKETRLLEWEGIQRTTNKNKGWNSFSKSVGIDDLYDPVWFFHTSTSRPWYYGGSVYSFNDRYWIGRDKNNIDRWTSDQKNLSIGSASLTSTNYNFWNNQTFISSGSYFGWTKSHTFIDASDNSRPSGNKFRIKNNINKGLFDQCRADQIPVIMGSEKIVKLPKTLIITDLGEDRDATDELQSPNAVFNNYVRLRERTKELMFLPTNLKIQFISAFEKWAIEEWSGDNGWLVRLDPLNFSDSSGISEWLTSTDGNYDTTYIQQKGKKGFLDDKFIKENKYNDSTLKNNWNIFVNYTNLDTLESKSKPTKTNNDKVFVSADEGINVTWCFTAGNKIKLANGENKNIQDLEPTDLILSYNFNTNQFEQSTFDYVSINYTENVINLQLDNGIKIICTDTHPIYIEDKGWSSYVSGMFVSNIYGELKQIVIGDKVRYYENGEFKSVGITKITKNNKGVRQVYNLANVSGNSTFIVNGVLVHNKI